MLSLDGKYAEMTQQNKSIMTHTHMLIAAGDEFVLCNEQVYRRASVNFAS
jgi:hypothetical protein